MLLGGLSLAPALLHPDTVAVRAFVQHSEGGAMANLLIIDDDVTGASALARLLEREGHHATYATSAGSALSHLHDHDPDLVLLDLTLPRVDGLDLLDALVAEPRFAHLRFVVYSGAHRGRRPRHGAPAGRMRLYSKRSELDRDLWENHVMPGGSAGTAGGC